MASTPATNRCNPCQSRCRAQDKAYTVPADSKLSPAFTRKRERTVGRLASLGLAFAWAGEVLTGLGPISQLARETGMPVAVS